MFTSASSADKLSTNLYEHGESDIVCAQQLHILDSVPALVGIRDFFMFKFKMKNVKRKTTNKNAKRPFQTFLHLLCVFSLLVFNFQFAIASNSAGVNYLNSAAPSAWTTMALASVGEAGLSGEHLKASPGSQAISYTAPIMAIAALGEDPRTYPSSDFVSALKGFFDGTQIGDSTTLNDDVFGILALVAAGESTLGTEIATTKSYLVGQQNSDGGWGFVAGGASDTNTTAAAIMALVAAGESASSATVQNALAYLQSAQNDDGGFPYDPVSPWGTNSDASSDAWVISAINAVGVNPTSWNKGGNNPITHLESLQTAEGYFQYQAGSGEDAFSAVTTSYAVIALNGGSYPVAVYSGLVSNDPVVSFRIEGSAETVCAGNVSAINALDVVKNAADVCGFTYNIDDTAYGPYLNQIAQDSASGMNGWMYRVNWQSPSVGAADYTLANGDSVLWYFGDFSWEPMRLLVSDSELESGDSTTFTVEAYGENGWSLVDSATVLSAYGDEWTTDNVGSLTLTPDDGIYKVKAEKEGYIRSDEVLVTVGDLSGHTVGVHANVTGTGGTVGGVSDTVSFIVTPDTVDFGSLKRGESAEDSVTIKNTGTADIYVEAIVSGGELFEQELELNHTHWADFSTTLNTASQEDITVGVTVPNNFATNGDQEGDIIFWATAE